jgi:hypothetical protein
MAESESACEYQMCFVAFLDILGFQSLVLESKDRSEKMRTIIESLRICGAFPPEGKKVSRTGCLEKLISVRTRQFSDTIVLFVKEDPEDLAQLCLMIRYLQDRLWENRICLRGAITLGLMYWPKNQENITVGPGVVEAYKLESEIAIYPRIVVSNELYSYIMKNKVEADPFGGGLHADKSNVLSDYIEKDADGVYFLDLLHPGILRTNDETLTEKEGEFGVYWNFLSETSHPYILQQVKQTIIGNIGAEDKKIRQKYEWLKTYVDNKCNNIRARSG